MNDVNAIGRHASPQTYRYATATERVELAGLVAGKIREEAGRDGKV
jgi:hypothetical protein